MAVSPPPPPERERVATPRPSTHVERHVATESLCPRDSGVTVCDGGDVCQTPSSAASQHQENTLRRWRYPPPTLTPPHPTCAGFAAFSDSRFAFPPAGFAAFPPPGGLILLGYYYLSLPSPRPPSPPSCHSLLSFFIGPLVPPENAALPAGGMCVNRLAENAALPAKWPDLAENAVLPARWPDPAETHPYGF